MIIDKQLELARNQAITASAPSTNSIDFGATTDGVIGRDIGAGTPMYAVVTFPVTFTAAGAATLTASVQDSTDNVTFSDRVIGPPLAIADLSAGKRLNLALPPGLKRYVRLNFTVATGPFTAGQLNAYVTDGYDYAKQYPATP